MRYACSDTKRDIVWGACEVCMLDEACVVAGETCGMRDGLHLQDLA